MSNRTGIIIIVVLLTLSMLAWFSHAKAVRDSRDRARCVFEQSEC